MSENSNRLEEILRFKNMVDSDHWAKFGIIEYDIEHLDWDECIMLSSFNCRANGIARADDMEFYTKVISEYLSDYIALVERGIV